MESEKGATTPIEFDASGMHDIELGAFSAVLGWYGVPVGQPQSPRREFPSRNLPVSPNSPVLESGCQHTKFTAVGYPFNTDLHETAVEIHDAEIGLTPFPPIQQRSSAMLAAVTAVALTTHRKLPMSHHRMA